jgi:NADH-quinone oxidoreductase subunit A
MDLNEWAFVGVFLAIAFILPAVPILLGWLLGPRKPNPIKNDTYECGIETVGDTWVQFKVQYYIFALVFVIFDVEMLFIFPWAVAYNNLGLFAFAAMTVFILILAVDLLFLWRKGALEWT